MQPKQKVRASTKMITFLDSLHKKYKILSKLTEKQSQNFQHEVITLLVDENQNVNQVLYDEIMASIGMQAFILEVLSNCVQRNPFSNQYELKKNISTIAEDLEKKSNEINKKVKVLDRREAELNKTEATLKNRIKEFGHQIEAECMNRLAMKEVEMKKNIGAVLNNLKLKEKIIMDRREEIGRKLAEISHKQKLMSNSSLKQKKVVAEVAPVSSVKSSKQLKEITQKYQQLKKQNEKLRKKYKTTDLAYSKLKHELQGIKKDRLALEQKLQKLQAKNMSNCYKKQEKCLSTEKLKLIDILDQLEISQIEGIMDSGDFRQGEKENMRANNECAYGINKQDLKQEREIIMKNELPQFLRESDVQQSIMSPMEVLQQILQYQITDEQQKMALIKSNLLLTFIERSPFEHNKNRLMQYFDTLLDVVQQSSPNYEQAIAYISNVNFQAFFQNAYLNYESNLEISEATTLLLSRIAIENKVEAMRLTNQFMAAIQLRHRVLEDSQQFHFLKSNLTFLLNMSKQ